MSAVRMAYLPLITYPDAIADGPVAAAVEFATAVGCALQVTSFAVAIPRVSTPIGSLLINVPEMIRATEENSRARCRHFEEIVSAKAGDRGKVHCATRQIELGLTSDAATTEARYFDVVLLPWSKDSPVANEFAQAVVFGAGRPSILVPAGVASNPIRHLAVAWDESRVAARALADAMSLLAEDCRITVLTVQDEKPLPDRGIAETLASSLARRGLRAEARSVPLGRRAIAEALQAAAMESGCQLLAMGGFGHSRIRDFVLGGATKGVFADLRLPVVLSH